MDDDRVESVDIITGETVSQERQQMGWLDPVTGGGISGLSRCNVYICPNQQTIECLLSKKTEESIHLFSGIRGLAFVYHAFLTSLDFKIRRGIITERPNTFAFGLANGKPLWLHKLRFMIQDRKYIPYIDYIFAIGEECADYYRSISKQWKVVPFAYCVADTQTPLPEILGGVLFVGSLSVRKNAGLLLKAASKMR